MVTSMKLCERPSKIGNGKSAATTKKNLSNEGNHLAPETEENRKPNQTAAKNNAVSGSNLASRSGSRRNSSTNNLPMLTPVNDQVNEMLLDQATRIDEKFYLENSPSDEDEPEPEEPPQKVEIFVKRFPLNHEELEEIEGSENEDELDETEHS